mgnify:CR=1 FL=1
MRVSYFLHKYEHIQGMEREEMMAEMKKANDAQAEQFKAILTPEQLEKYKTMQSQARPGGGPRE